MSCLNTKSFDILIVDDVIENIDTLREFLSHKGFKIRAAISGEIAIRSAQHFPPDLILLDIKMPGMNGFEICTVLKQDEKLREIPIIFLSALDDIKDKVTAFDLGAVDYITKPFKEEEVVARIQTHLKLQYAKEEILYNGKFQEIIAEISSDFVSANHLNISGKINYNLIRISEFLKVDKTAFFLLSESSTIATILFEQCFNEIENNFSIHEFPFYIFNWTNSQILNKELFISIPITDNLPKEASVEIYYFKKYKIKSALILPLYTDKGNYGFLCFYAIKDYYYWNETQIHGLSIVAQLISSALNRVESEKTLLKIFQTIQKDLKSARIIQQSIIGNQIPFIDYLTISYRYVPMIEIGGDFMSFTVLAEGGVGIFIGDVEGHGISAALLTSMLKVITDKACRLYGTKPKDYLKKLNDELIKSNLKQLITGIYAIIEKINENQFKLRFSRGGHPFPIYYSSSNKKVSMIESKGFVLGSFSNLVYEEKEIILNKGDRLFFYTDGVSEIKNPKNEMIGYNNLEKFIHNCFKVTPDETLDAIISEIHKFREDQPIDDDILIICIEIK